jgi:hypothetical protein
MKLYTSIAISLILVTAALFFVGRYTVALDDFEPMSSAGAPTIVSYQGQVTVDGRHYDGTGYFKFAVVNQAGDTTYWSNDGSSTDGGEPTTTISLTVTGGLFNVLLGDTSLTNMIALTSTAFEETERYLRVWFSDDNVTFSSLTPIQRIAAVPYALQAASAPWSGLTVVPLGFADDLDGVEYDNIVIVAKSGGDFTSIQGAIDTIEDAEANNRYLIWVGPGRYDEQVTLKPYVYLHGSDRWITIIESNIGSSTNPPVTATLKLSSNTGVRRITILAASSVDNNAAIIVPAGSTHILLTDVYAASYGAGTINFGIIVTGTTTSVAIDQVDIGAANGTDTNTGMLISGGADVTLHGGAYWAMGGTDSYAIINSGSNTNLETYSISAQANRAVAINIALLNTDNARANLHGGSFNGRDGSGVACGICNEDGGFVSTIGAEVEGESTTGTGFGLLNDGGTAQLQGGRFHAEGTENSDAYAISNNSNEVAFAPSLMVRDVWASVFGADTCITMLNQAGGSAMLVGGEFWAGVCNNNYGLYNTGSESSLEINNVLVNSSGGFDNFFAVFAGANTTTKISHSELRGDDYALNIDGGSGSLQFVYLNGDLVGDASNLDCNAITQNGTFYADNCPSEVP